MAHFDKMHMREEWDSLREHDVVFLISIQSPHVSRPVFTTSSCVLKTTGLFLVNHSK